MNNNGKVYILGAGPGDVSLLTLKGKKIISQADCIIYDRLINKNILKFCKKEAELIYLGKKNTEGGFIQNEINKLLVEKAKEGKNIARVKGGDPFVFGRGGEEIEELIANNIDFEIVPGITSSISVPTYSGIPVTHRGIARSFHVFTGHTMADGVWHDFSVIAKLEGTLVFLMGIKNLPTIVDDLIKNGKNPKTPVAIIENGCFTTQRITEGTLENIVKKSQESKIKPPAITIIGDVVEFRNQFKWFEKKELFGKRVMVTRDNQQAMEMIEKIEELGGQGKSLPFISIQDNTEKIPELQEYKGILFNSPNGVEKFMDKLDDIRKIAHLKIGVVGDKTCKMLEKYKIVPDFMPKEYTIDKLAEKVVEFTEENDKILVVTSDISPENCQEYGKKYNRVFEKMVAYNTKKIKYDKLTVEKELKEVDIITFLSSSAVDGFMESIEFDNEILKGLKIASIGSVTSKKIRDYGLDVDYEAKKYNIQGVIDSIK